MYPRLHLLRDYTRGVIMEFESIEKIHQGKFITRYDIHYKTASGKAKTYEMISRNPDIMGHKDMLEKKPHAVVMIMHDCTGQKLLLCKEYRMAVGESIYNFPAGLIDPGESYEEAAARELREETGLTLMRIDEVWKPSYSAVGFSNERNVVVLGVAGGEIRPSDSELEEIQAEWFDKKQIREILKDERLSARTQTYCAMWCRQ